MSILLFEDSAVPKLSPITTARPAFCVTVGSYHLLDLVRMTNQPIVAMVRHYLSEVTGLDHADLKLTSDGGLVSPQRPLGDGPKLALNARIEPSVESLRVIETLLQSNDSFQPTTVWDGDQLAAIVHPGWTWEAIQQSGSTIDSLVESAKSTAHSEQRLSLLNFPHDVIAGNMRVINSSLEHRIASERYRQTSDGVFLGNGTKIGDYVLTDTSGGPIVIDDNASVGPYTLLKGPIYIGAGARILEHAAIKDEVSIGHTTKIGGEVEAAIVEPYSNKQHHGFLGHSYLGSWINLGAGTCNSDLKNTYGTVNMEYPHGKAATGMQFLGCVMGDYSKSAINTGIFTGKVIGVCSMMYGFVTSNVPSYVNYARLFGQIATLPPEVMIATQQRMFSRRKVEQRPCDIQLLHDMYRLTQFERDQFGEAISF